MMKKFLLTLLCFIQAILYSQTMFQKTYGGSGTDVGRAVCVTHTGGYVIVGNSDSFGSGGDNMYIIRTNSLGDTLWTRTYGTSSYDMALSVNSCGDGGFIFTGDFTLSGITLPLMKIDANGNIQWTTSTSGVGNYVHQTNDNGYILVGNSNADVIAVKTNSAGNAAWIKTFGGIDFDFGNMIQQTTDGGYIITGSTKSFSGPDFNVYLLKLDAAGNLMWSRTFGGSDEDRGQAIRQTSDGGYIIAGYSKSFVSSNLASDWYIIKTNNSGNLIWSKTIGCLTSIDEAYDIQETPDGGLLALGNMGCNYDTQSIVKMDALGNVLWSKAYGNGAGNSNCFAQTPDKGFILTGRVGTNVYLVKTDSLGNSVCNYTSFVVTSTSAPTSSAIPATLTGSDVVGLTPSLTLNGGGVITTNCLTVGNKSIQLPAINLSMSPNPAHDFTMIELPYLSDQIKLICYNSIGQLVNFPFEISDRRLKINLNNLRLGLYYLKISSSDGFWTGKLVVE